MCWTEVLLANGRGALVQRLCLHTVPFVALKRASDGTGWSL